MLSARMELERFLDRKGVQFASALLDIARHSMDRGGIKYNDAVLRLADVIQQTMVLSDLYGRRRGLMEADFKKRRRRAGRFADEDTTPIVPGVPFDAAIERIVDAEPRLARSAEQVSQLYNRQKVFAMARSASMNVTERVQKEIGAWMREGKSQSDIENIILNIGKEADAGDVRAWTRSYAATVYRTNAATSYSTGRFKQAADPDVREVIPAFMLVGPDDERKRQNHRAALGLIAEQDDPVWNTWRPPLGYNCRDGVEYQSIYDLERMGRIKNGKVEPRYPSGIFSNRPDPGFQSKAVRF